RLTGRFPAWSAAFHNGRRFRFVTTSLYDRVSTRFHVGPDSGEMIPAGGMMVWNWPVQTDSAAPDGDSVIASTRKRSSPYPHTSPDSIPPNRSLMRSCTKSLMPYAGRVTATTGNGWRRPGGSVAGLSDFGPETSARRNGNWRGNRLGLPGRNERRSRQGCGLRQKGVAYG